MSGAEVSTDNVSRAGPAASRLQEHIDARAAFDAGLAAYADRDLRTAIACFNSAVAHRHDDADAHNNLGLSYLEAGDDDDAMDAFLLAIHFRPHFPAAYYNLALAALQRGVYDEAIENLEHAIELSPGHAAAHNTLGYIFTHVTGSFERGAEHIRTALELSPADPDVLCNYSAVLTQEGHTEKAVQVCESLLANHPNMHEARLNRALACLKLGRYADGWPDYEARKLARGNYAERNLPFDEWQGQSLHGKKLLIYAEQGLGDQIMFASCVPDVLHLAGSCLIECASALAPMFTRSFPAASVLSQGADDESLAALANEVKVDYQVAIGSLPAHFRKTRDHFPQPAAYLHADPARCDYWRRRLHDLGPGLKVGISWAGGAPSTRGASRSMQLAQWIPILQIPRCHFVSLQYGNAAADLPAFCQAQQLRVHDWRDARANSEETAALITELDLIVTVQTAAVHLAGALGQPTWVLLQAACEWRYGERGATMPWYLGVRLFRQSRQNEWQPVVEQIAHDLAALALR
jgi:Flp pilus assembly protein TadD